MRTFTLFSIAVLMLAGCNRTEEDLLLEVHPEHIECMSEGGEFEIEVQGPQDWVTDNTADWIDISREQSSALVKISEAKGADRQNRIMFSSGSQRAYLYIRQSGAHIFSISTTEIKAGYKGGSWTVAVECHEPWTVSCESGWVVTDITEASSPQEVTVGIAESHEKEEREAGLRFSCNGTDLTVRIIQDPGPYIALEKETVETDGDGGSYNVLYISNTDVNVSTDADWIRLIGGLEGQKKVGFEVLRNISQAREGSIFVTSVVDPGYGKTITVKQGPKIDHPALSFEEGYSMDIRERTSFVLHPVFTDMSDLSLTWTSDHPEIASVSEDGTVTIHTGGTCTITANNRFHGVSATISLNIRLEAVSMKIMLDRQDMEENPLAVRFPGEILTVRPVLEPADAYAGDIICISSDPSVAATDGMTIKCLSPGSVIVSVESLYHGIRKSFSLLVLED